MSVMETIAPTTTAAPTGGYEPEAVAAAAAVSYLPVPSPAHQASKTPSPPLSHHLHHLNAPHHHSPPHLREHPSATIMGLGLPTRVPHEVAVSSAMLQGHGSLQTLANVCSLQEPTRLPPPLIANGTGAAPPPAAPTSDSPPAPATAAVALPAGARFCEVCHRQAGKHNYYGGKVCTSCRAFFRRSVQSGRHPDFKCDQVNECKIDSKSWKSCQKCRFQKCLSAGMKTNWVLSDSQRESRNHVRQEAKHRRTEAQKKLSVALMKAPSEGFTLEETVFLQGLYERGQQNLWEIRFSVFKKYPELFEKAMEFVNTRRLVSSEARKVMEELTEQESRNFYSKIGDMLELSPEDQNQLLSANCPRVIEFVHAACLGSRDTMNDQMRRFINFFTEQFRQNKDLQPFQLQMEKHNITLERDYPALEYESLYPKPWATADPAEVRHREIVGQMAAWCRNPDTGGTDKILTMLMILIMLFSTEDEAGKLKKGRLVDSIQTKYTHMLYRYLKEKYPRSVASKKFCSGIFLGALAREASDIKKEKLLAPAAAAGEKQREEKMDAE